jgi:very-short-patch-repair endonuclease
MPFLTNYRERREIARQMRRESTSAEEMVWSRLRNRRLAGMKFRRQFPLGRFFADFCCLEQRLIVEVDGTHHREQATADEERTLFLAEAGFRVIRVENDEVIRSMESVCRKILKAIPLP